MDYFIPILTIVLAHILATLTPGPNLFVSVKQGLSCSRMIAFYTVAGLGAGNFIHIMLGFVGLSAIIAQSVWLYSLLKYMGAAYLVFLGLKSLLIRQKSQETGFENDVVPTQMSNTHAFRMGLLTCLSNPKAVMYYLALFTTIIPPNTPLYIKCIIIVLLPFISGVWHSFIVVSMGYKPSRQFYSYCQKWINVIFGSLMVTIGLKIAFSEK